MPNTRQAAAQQATPLPGIPATGILLVLNDVNPCAEQEFNLWYQEQHLPERLSVPGFSSGRRYRALSDGRRYMALYECETIEVLSSAAYAQRLAHPTAWTTKMMPHFRNMLRSACRETWSLGHGIGGVATVTFLKPVQGKADEARRFVSSVLGPECKNSGSLVRMALWEADAGYSGGATAETTLRGQPDDAADWVLFAESIDAGRASEVLAETLQEHCGQAAQILETGDSLDYRLLCQVNGWNAACHHPPESRRP